MRTTTPILSSLFRAISGTSEAEPEDAVIRFLPVGVLAYSPPLVCEQFSTMNVSNDRRTSGMVNWDETVLLDSNNTLVNLVEGVWRLSGYLSNEGGGVNDINAFHKIMLQASPVGGAATTVDLVKIRCNIGSLVAIPFDYVLSVSKKSPIQAFLVIENGGGACGHRSIGCLSYQRLI